MATNTISARQRQMVQQQIEQRGITEPRLIEALLNTPRDHFLEPARRDEAFADRPASIGHGQTLSQPYIVALMTDRLDVQAHHRVLEIGTGSGYQTTILSKLASEVWSMEYIKPLLDEAFERLHAMGVKNAHFRHADGSLGWPDVAPFDRILIAATAPKLPEELLRSQLADGGVAILPIGGQESQVLTLVRKSGGALLSEDVCGVRFVPLRGEAGFAETDWAK